MAKILFENNYNPLLLNELFWIGCFLSLFLFNELHQLTIQHVVIYLPLKQIFHFVNMDNSYNHPTILLTLLCLKIVENLYLCITTMIIISHLIDYLKYSHFIIKHLQASIIRYLKDLKFPNLIQNQFLLLTNCFVRVLSQKLIFYIIV